MRVRSKGTEKGKIRRATQKGVDQSPDSEAAQSRLQQDGFNSRSCESGCAALHPGRSIDWRVPQGISTCCQEGRTVTQSADGCGLPKNRQGGDQGAKAKDGYVVTAVRKDSALMTNDSTLWTTLRRYLPRRRWVPIADIFRIVQHRLPLDNEDLAHVSSHSKVACWQSNVRRVLHSKQREGTLSGRKSA
jgi:hypothetical protein